MARAPALFVCLLFLVPAVALAGCAATEDEAATSQESVPADPGKLKDASAPGWIRGAVVDETLAPVVGATLRLQDANVTLPEGNGTLSAVTDALGRFEFRNLANGRYLVKGEAEGYRSASQVAEVRNGTVFDVTMRLDRIPKLEAYEDAQEFNGLLSCNALVVTGAGRTPYDCGSADPNARGRFLLPLNAGAQGLVLELSWEPTTPASSHLRLTAETKGYGAQDTILGEADGAGYVRLEVGSGAMSKYYPQGGEVVLKVEPAPSVTGDEASADVGVAFQQAFTVVATAFYNGGPPEGYTRLQGGA